MSDTNSKIIDKHLGDLSVNVDEIMSSTIAVKGNVFAQAVAINFEVIQLAEIIGRLASVAEEECSGYASALTESSKTILAAILDKACDGLTDADLKEAISVATALNKHRTGAIESIKHGMRDGDGD